MSDKLRCLLVEDSSATRRLFNFALSQIKNLSVIEATHGFEALKIMEDFPVDLIIADINMPVMDGLKLVKHVRSDDSNRDVQIMIVTAESGVEDRNRALYLGANSYMRKPVRLDQITNEVVRLFEDRGILLDQNM